MSGDQLPEGFLEDMEDMVVEYLDDREWARKQRASRQDRRQSPAGKPGFFGPRRTDGTIFDRAKARRKDRR